MCAAAPRRCQPPQPALPRPTPALQSSRALLDRGVPPDLAPLNAGLCAVRAACPFWPDEGAPAAAALVTAAAATTGSNAAALASPSSTPLSWLDAGTVSRAGLGSSSSSSSSSAAGPWRGSGSLPPQPLARLVAASAAAAAAASRGTLRAPSVSAPSDVATSVGALKRKRAGEDDFVHATDDAVRATPALVALRCGSAARACDADADTVALWDMSDDDGGLPLYGAAGAEAAGVVAVVTAPRASASAPADTTPLGACCPPHSLVVSSPWHAPGPL